MGVAKRTRKFAQVCYHLDLCSSFFRILRLTLSRSNESYLVATAADRRTLSTSKPNQTATHAPAKQWKTVFAIYLKRHLSCSSKQTKVSAHLFTSYSIQTSSPTPSEIRSTLYQVLWTYYLPNVYRLSLIV